MHYYNVVQTAVAAGQLPLRESFRDFDGLEKGVCTKDQAHAVLLSVLRINLSEVSGSCPEYKKQKIFRRSAGGIEVESAAGAINRKNRKYYYGAKAPTPCLCDCVPH